MHVGGVFLQHTVTAYPWSWPRLARMMLDSRSEPTLTTPPLAAKVERTACGGAQWDGLILVSVAAPTSSSSSSYSMPCHHMYVRSVLDDNEGRAATAQ